MSSTPQAAAAPPETDDPWLQDEQPRGKRISLFDVLLMLARQRRMVLRMMLAGGVIALLYAVLLPASYESTLTFLPPVQISSRGVGGSIQDLSAALSSAEGFTFKSAEDFWTAVLKGRTIAQRVINAQDLMRVYHAKRFTDAENELHRRTRFDIDKAGLISITVRDHVPQRAADIANSYITGMHQAMDDMAIEDAKQRMAFFNAQVQEERKNLGQAEDNLIQVEQRTGVIALGGQTQEAIGQIADLRARITFLNVQLQALRASATDENPEVQRMKTEIGADQAELAKAESKKGKVALGDIGASDVPQATLEYITAAREVRYHEALYDALGKQVEAARMDQARSAPMIQILDKAVPADHPAGLGKIATVLLGTFFGLIAGAVVCIVRQLYWNLKASREGQEKLKELSATLQGNA